MDLTPEQPITPNELTHIEPALAPTSVPAFSLRKIFVGPFGLRAGWGLLIYMGIIFLAISAVQGAQRAVKNSHRQATAAAPAKPAPTPRPNASEPQPILGMVVAESILFVLVFLLSLLMAVIEHRKVLVFGLGDTQSVSRFSFGALWGLLAMSLLVGSLRIAHLLTFDALLIHGPAILLWGVALAAAFLLVGLFEEYFFRGYLQFTLTRGFVGLGHLISPRHARAIAFWIASVLTSALFLFAHTHNGGEDKFGLITVFLAGVVFVIALWRTGSLWWAIGFHTAWDWAQSFLFGVPDSGGLIQGRLFDTHASGNPLFSGGTVGPEGSLLIIPVLLLIIVVLFFTHPSPQPPLEPEPPKHLPPLETFVELPQPIV